MCATESLPGWRARGNRFGHVVIMLRESRQVLPPNYPQHIRTTPTGQEVLPDVQMISSLKLGVIAKLVLPVAKVTGPDQHLHLGPGADLHSCLHGPLPQLLTTDNQMS